MGGGHGSDGGQKKKKQKKKKRRRRQQADLLGAGGPPVAHLSVLQRKDHYPLVDSDLYVSRYYPVGHEDNHKIEAQIIPSPMANSIFRTCSDICWR